MALNKDLRHHMIGLRYGQVSISWPVTNSRWLHMANIFETLSDSAISSIYNFVFCPQRGICYCSVSVGVLSKRLNALSWFLTQSLYLPIILHCVIRKCEWYLHKSVNSTDCPAKHNSSDWTSNGRVAAEGKRLHTHSACSPLLLDHFFW